MAPTPHLKLGSLKRAGFAIHVSTPSSDEEAPGYQYVQAFAVLVSIVACVSAAVMTYKGGLVYLDIAKDPYGRDLVVGAWVGIPTALAGAVSAYLGGQGRKWDLLHYAAALMVLLNLLLPLAWIIMALIV